MEGSTMVRRLVLVGLLVVSASNARAASQTVRGSQLAIKNPGATEKRKVTVKARETPTGNTIVGDLLGSGATLTVTANGATPSSDTFSLPAGTSTSGKPFWTGDPVKGFKYGDPDGENGPVKSGRVRLRNGVFEVKVAVDGKLGPIDVVPPNPGTDGCAVFTILGGDSYHVRFASGRVTNKGTALFKVVKPTVEGFCLPSTTTTTSSTTTTTLGFPDIPPPGDPPLRYRDEVFANFTKTTDVVYGMAVNNSGQTVTLKLDIYEPTGDTVTERPAIVWIHGGSFCCGDKNSPEIVDEAQVFSRKGYFNVSINYRLEPGGCSAGGPTPTCITAIQEALADAQTAVQWLRTNQGTYGIDETRIAAAGSSAGAITALNVGFSSTENPAASVGAAVSLSGARLLGTIDSTDAPSLLFHGTSDVVVPYQWAVNTWNQANNQGLDSFLTSFPGDGHVPYQHRTQILDETTNFLWWEMDLANAAQ